MALDRFTLPLLSRRRCPSDELRSAEDATRDRCHAVRIVDILTAIAVARRLRHNVSGDNLRMYPVYPPDTEPPGTGRNFKNDG
jgi:hypothetical protein